MIDIQNLTYTYPNRAEPALKQLTFKIEKGEWVAVIGHNGSGKSTLAKLLTGLLTTKTGQIKINDLIINEENIFEIRNLVGMVFQNPDNQFVGATVEDDVAFGLENRQIERPEMKTRVKEALGRVGMLEFAKREPAHLSGGQKQRVALASALVIEPQVLILDEATAMLDPKGRREMIDLVRALKIELGAELTVISITHDIDEAAHADRVIVINDGQLIEKGQPAQVFNNAAKLIELGLNVPFAEQLKAKLAQRGVKVPQTYETTDGMVNWLWQSISKQ